MSPHHLTNFYVEEYLIQKSRSSLKNGTIVIQDNTAVPPDQKKGTIVAPLLSEAVPNGLLDLTNVFSHKEILIIDLSSDGALRRMRNSDHSKLRNRLLDFSVQTYSQNIFVDSIEFSNLTWSPEAKKTFTLPNAGGNSIYSEALSIEYFVRYFYAKNVIYEMEISYCTEFKMIDYLCTLNDITVGVSVTRAMNYRNPYRFTLQDAQLLLHKKLYGLIVSRNCVNTHHCFDKAILHVWCQNDWVAKKVQEAYESFDDKDYGLGVKEAVIVVITVCSEYQIYFNKLQSDTYML